MKKLLLAALVAATLTSCLSSKVRDEALLPAASLAWPGVRADVERGIADAVEDGDLLDSAPMLGFVLQLEAVLADGAPRDDLKLVPWSTLEPYGKRGIADRIEDGEMHPLVAESLYQRLKNFTLAFDQLLLAHIRLSPSTTREHWLDNGGGRVTSQTAIAVATSN